MICGVERSADLGRSRAFSGHVATTLHRPMPDLPGKRYEDWELTDPAGLPIDEVRPIRDDIERRVKDLLTSFVG